MEGGTLTSKSFDFLLTLERHSKKPFEVLVISKNSEATSVICDLEIPTWAAPEIRSDIPRASRCGNTGQGQGLLGEKLTGPSLGPHSCWLHWNFVPV